MGMNVNNNYPVFANSGNSNVDSTKSASTADGEKKQSWLSRLFKGKNMATRERQLNNLHSKLDYLEEQLQGASGEKAEKLEKKKEKLEKKIEKKEAKKEKYENKLEEKKEKLEEKLENADGKKAERLEKKIGKIENELEGSSSKKSDKAGAGSAADAAGSTSGKTSSDGDIEKMGKFDDDKEGGQYTNNQVYDDWKNMDDNQFNEKYAKDGVLTASETYTPDSIRSLLGKMSKSEAGKVLLKEDFGIDNPDKLSKMSDKDLVKKFYTLHKKAADEQAKVGGKGGGAAATAFDTSGLKQNPPSFRQLTIYQGKENHVMSADAGQMTDDPDQARGMSPDMLYG